MKNRMQDLDFEQNVAFDKVQEYEFTRRAAQRFRQVHRAWIILTTR